MASVCIDLTKHSLSAIDADVRQQLADRRAALAVTGHREVRPGERELLLVRRHAGQALTHADGRGQVFAVHRPQQRLVVEQVEL